MSNKRQTFVFEPEDVEVMMAAMRKSWQALRFSRRGVSDSPVALDEVAALVVEVAREDREDPEKVCTEVLRRLPPLSARYES